jgi:carbonic anhydrase/acetyltransferase-like protein (isoleucine patch superfamily)
MAIYQLGDKIPQIHPEAYVAEEAVVIGDVKIGAKSTIWGGVVIRGDNEPITIGDSSVFKKGQSCTLIKGCPLTIGNNVTIGHQAMLHGCTIEDGALIGIQAVVLNNAVIGKEALVGAGAIVTEGKVFAARKMILGAPAKEVKDVSQEMIDRIAKGTIGYANRAKIFTETLKRIG